MTLESQKDEKSEIEAMFEEIVADNFTSVQGILNRVQIVL